MSIIKNYSELETKEDSLEQILRLSGLPDKFKLRAFEFNLVRAKINHLKYLLDNLELTGGEGIAGLEIVLFRFFIGGFEPSSYATYINDKNPFEVLPGQIPKFRFLIYLPNELPKITSYSIRGVQQGIFGEGGSRLLTEADLFIDFERNATADELEEETETQIITFPNISGNIEDWLQSQDPVITLQPQADGLVIFRGNLFAQDESYLFIGPRGDYGVGAENTALAGHFEPLRESCNSNTITVDSAFSTTSLNPLQNKVLSIWANRIKSEIKELFDNYPVDGLSAFEVWLADGNEGSSLEDYYLFITGEEGIDAGLIYISQWNPKTNTPTLSNSDTSKFRYAYISLNSFTRFGIDWEKGDYLVYDVNGNIFKEENPLLNIVSKVGFSNKYGDLDNLPILKRTNKPISESTYTLLLEDVYKFLVFSVECTVTVPYGLLANLEFQGIQGGSGQVNFITETDGFGINRLNVFSEFLRETAGQHCSWRIRTQGNNVAVLTGTLKPV
jgi:hypothetical protein